MNQREQNEDVITPLQYIEARDLKNREVNKQNFEQALVYRKREEELFPLVLTIAQEYEFTKLC